MSESKQDRCRRLNKEFARLAPADAASMTNEIEELQERNLELESALKRQGAAAKMGMDAAKKDAAWREDNAKRLLAESSPAAIESERAMNAELTEEIEHLQDLVIKQGEMLSAIVNIVKGPPAENSLHSTHDVVEGVRKLNALVWGGDKEVFVLRKQAEAIDYVLSDIEIMLWHGVEFVAVSNIEYYANTLRAEADAEGDTNED